MSPLPDVPADRLPTDAVLLDVREDDEWAAGHIEGATHIPMSELPAAVDSLPAADPLYVVCRSGNRSGQVVRWLDQQGVDAVNVAGGMRAWHSAGRPMVAESGGEPIVL